MKIRQMIEKLLSNRYFLILLFIPYIKPATELTGRFDAIFDVLKIFSFIFVFVAFMTKKEKKTKIVFLLSMIQIIFVVATILNSGEIWWIIVQSASVISLLLLFEMALQINKQNALFAFSVSLLIMALLTAISMYIYYPNGMYIVEGAKYAEHNNFLWGFDNSSVFKIIPSIIISGIYFYKYANKKWIGIPFYLFIASAYIYVNSMTAGAVLIVLVFFYSILVLKNGTIKKMDIKYILPIIAVLFALFLVFYNHLNIIKDIAMNLNKGYSLNSRIKMWNTAIDYISKKPVLGYGFEFKSVIKEKFMYDHVHNLFFDILYRGGLAAFGVYILSIVAVIKNNKKITKSYNIIVLGVIGIVLCGIMDYYNDQYLMYLLLVAAFYARYIESKENTFIEYENR